MMISMVGPLLRYLAWTGISEPFAGLVFDSVCLAPSS